jgi:hypothetical protein
MRECNPAGLFRHRTANLLNAVADTDHSRLSRSVEIAPAF